MTEVLALVGSRRRSGNCDVMARKVLLECASMGMKGKIIYLDELDIKSCRGCLRCVIKGACGQQDDMEQLMHSLLSAKALLVTAPTYLFSPAAVVKALIDRCLMLSAHLDELDVSRPAVTISVAGNPLWNPLGPELLNQLAFAFGFTVVNYLEAYAPGPAEVTLTDAYTKGAKQMARSLAQPAVFRREPGVNQCPTCYSRTFSTTAKGIQCPFCLRRGEIGAGGKLHFYPEGSDGNFWTVEHRKRHLQEWILATREMLFKNRKAVKAELKQLQAEETKS